MIRVVGDRVLVALPPRVDETVSAGGIVLVKDPDRFYTPSQGIVMQVGEKSWTVDLDDVEQAIKDSYRFVDDPRKLTLFNLDVFESILGSMRPTPFDVQEGDCVIFPRSAGEEIHDDGIDYVVLRESEIIGIVEPKETEAA